MPPPAMIAFDDGLAHQFSDNEWKGFNVFPGECPKPNPNLSFLVKKAIIPNEKSTNPVLSRASERADSFRMVLPPAMPPPRDSAVPLPTLPEPMITRKKLSRQESILFMRKAFCLSLPGFGKHKPVRSPSKRQDSMEKKMTRASSFTNVTLSIRTSLENFECGSWASTTALPRGRDVQEPLTSGFLFDREALAPRGVLKTRSSRFSGRDHQRSAETSPRVRFTNPSSLASVSCPNSPPSCITPRLRKARDDFNTFLASQNA